MGAYYVYYSTTCFFCLAINLFLCTHVSLPLLFERLRCLFHTGVSQLTGTLLLDMWVGSNFLHYKQTCSEPPCLHLCVQDKACGFQQFSSSCQGKCGQ